jgi:hypothetical protein
MADLRRIGRSCGMRCRRRCIDLRARKVEGGGHQGAGVGVLGGGHDAVGGAGLDDLAVLHGRGSRAPGRARPAGHG